MYPPRSNYIRTIDAVKVPKTHEVGPVVLCDTTGPIGELKSLVLDFGRIGVEIERRQDVVLDVGSTVQEDVWVETPQSPENLHPRGGLVDNVLIGTLQIIKHNPVHVDFC